MTTSTSTTSSDINRGHIRDDVKQIKHDMARVKDDVGAVASDVANTGIEAIHRGAEATRNAGKRVGESAAEAHDALRRHVAEHPTSSILIAVGVGALLSRLIPRH